MITGNADPAIIAEILHRLATDDAFREQFVGDPNGALAPYGMTIDPTEIPVVRTLASKETLAAERDQLQTKIESDLKLIPFLLK